jgi:hypothetical protein
LRGMTDPSMDCGQDALLVMFDACMKVGSLDTFNNQEWLISVLSCPFAGQRVALKAMKEIILTSSTHRGSAALATSAADLVSRVFSEPGNEMLVDSTKPVKSKYVGPMDEEATITAATNMWRSYVRNSFSGVDKSADRLSGSVVMDSSTAQVGANNKGRNYITERKRDQQFVDADFIRLPSLPVSSDNLHNNSLNNTSTTRFSDATSSEQLSPTRKKTRKQILDVRDALQDPYARARLLAHAADKGYDLFLLQKYEHLNFVEGLDKEEVWRTFQRSRWWLFEENSTE